jgi:hypothetical protein
MQSLYFTLAALHLVAVVVTGILWAAYDLGFHETAASPARYPSGAFWVALSRALVHGLGIMPSIDWRSLRGIRSFFQLVWAP